MPPSILHFIPPALPFILALFFVVSLVCALIETGVVEYAYAKTGSTPIVSPQQTETSYLPTGAASQIVTVSPDGPAAAGITVLTQAVAIKETGPAETVSHFGEVYTFSPPFIAVYRDEPTELSFWNLQADDEHDFMLADPSSNVLMKVLLPPLQETPYVFTFHQEGLFSFYCTMHQPEMSGQILVLPAKPSGMLSEK